MGGLRQARFGRFSPRQRPRERPGAAPREASLAARARPLAARWGPDALAAGCAALGSLVVVALALHLWDMDPRVPLATVSDATFNVAVVKAVLAHGWFLSNPDLGAPLGQHLQDFAAFNGDLTQLAVVKILGLGLSNPAVVANADYLLTYPLVALVTYAVLRALGIGPPVAAVVTIIFTILPYHLVGGLGRLFLGAYWAVPILGYLAIAVLEGRPLFRRRPGVGRLRSLLTARTGMTVLMIVVVACSDAYYASFAIGIVLLATVAGAIARRSRATLVTGLVVTGLVLVGLAATQAPTILYRAQNGDNPAVGHRQAWETQNAGLSLTDLLLPIHDHRIGAFSDLTTRYQNTAIAPAAEHNTQALGIVGSLGLVWLALTLVAAALAPGRWAFLRDRRHSAAAIAAAITFLIGTVGGLGTMFAYVVSPQLRSLGRISVVVAFFALFAVALVLDRLGRRLGPAPRRRAAFAGALAVVLVVAALDQVSPHLTPAYAKDASGYRSDAALVFEMQHVLPPGAAIFQLPYMAFPENGPIGNMQDYDGFRGYLHSTRLRWSYGAVKGRLAANVDAGVAHTPAPAMVRQLVALGFDGIWVDTAGYADGGAQTLAQLSAALGEAPVKSPNGRMAFYSLTAYAANLRRTVPAERIKALRALIFNPVSPQFGAGFYGAEVFGNLPGRWAPSRAVLDVFDPVPHTLTVDLSMVMTAPASPRSHVTVERPDGSRVTFVVTPAWKRFTVRLTVHPGHNPLRIATDARRVPPTAIDHRDLRIQVIDPSVTYPGL